jgi:uncharacterized membrane protein
MTYGEFPGEPGPDEGQSGPYPGGDGYDPYNPYPAGGTGPTFSVGDAISYAWEKFIRNWTVWVPIALFSAAIPWLLQQLTPYSVTATIAALRGNANPDDADPPAHLHGLNLLGWHLWDLVAILLMVLVSALISAALARGALRELDGHRPDISSFFRFHNVWRVVVLSVLIGVVESIGLILCVVPGVVLTFLLMFSFFFLIDQNLDPLNAMVASIKLVWAHFGKMLLLALLMCLLTFLGLLVCGVGLLVTTPLCILASAYAYRVLTGRFVSDPQAG